MIAAVDLDAGSPVTINYIHLHLPNSVRRPKISENWYFDCACARCSDVTELGTMVDAVACKDCPSEEGGGGFLLPKRALDQVIIIDFTIREICLRLKFLFNYRVAHHVSDLGWVDFDFGYYSIVCLIVFGLMRDGQNGQSRWGG